MTDSGVARIEGCENLTDLSLSHTRVSDACLAHFEGCKDLTSLLLYNNPQVSDAGLAQLKGCKSLRALSVKNTKVSAAGIDEVKTALPGCKIEWDGGVDEPR